jgi:GDP-L-fucose synthase
MEKDSKIYVAGHRGLVGAAIVRCLRKLGFENLVTRSRAELNLTSQVEVEGFFNSEKPDYVFLAAAKVGGIQANNTYPADFIRDNLQIQTNIIDSAYRNGVKKLAFLGSSCIYPKFAPQPMREEHLLTGELEPTNEWYAIAKIAGIKMCQAYRRQYGFNAISLMPTNLYGPGDNFNLANSHVLPALIRKFHEAKINNASNVTVWGTGTPKREFLHVDDLADASVFLMNHYDEESIVNVGVGEDVSIGELAQLVKDVVGFSGEIVYDASKPDGTPRKLLDVSKLNALGWKAKIELRDGVASTYDWYLEHQGEFRD